MQKEEKEQGKQKATTTQANILDVVLKGVSGGLISPINISMSGVSSNYQNTSAVVASGVSGGSGGLTNPAKAATGYGGPSSSISLGSTTDTTGGFFKQGNATATSVSSSLSGTKNNVTINLTIGKATADEAKQFAEMVKTYLEDEKLTSNMGRK